MSNTPSNMLPLGISAPDFKLEDVVSKQFLELDKLKGKNGTVLYFICNHCPFVIHVIEEMVAIANNYAKEGIGFIAISSNEIKNYPQDAPPFMKVFAEKNQFSFPYLFDETQKVAKDYDAACTPDIYAFDNDLKLVYRGQLDDSRPGNNIPVTGSDLRLALDCILSNQEISKFQKPSIGCNIKWK